jgi:hypothetical protein
MGGYRHAASGLIVYTARIWQVLEYIPKERCRAVRVGIGKRRMLASPLHAEVIKLSFDRGESAANLSQRICPGPS